VHNDGFEVRFRRDGQFENICEANVVHRGIRPGGYFEIIEGSPGDLGVGSQFGLLRQWFVVGYHGLKGLGVMAL